MAKRTKAAKLEESEVEAMVIDPEAEGTVEAEPPTLNPLPEGMSIADTVHVEDMTDGGSSDSERVERSLVEEDPWKWDSNYSPINPEVCIASLRIHFDGRGSGVVREHVNRYLDYIRDHAGD